MLLATVEKVNEIEYKKVYREVTGWLDRHENELIPQVSVSSKRIIFDDILFNQRIIQNIQLQNIGKSPVQFQIIDSRIFSPDRERHEFKRVFRTDKSYFLFVKIECFGKF